MNDLLMHRALRRVRGFGSSSSSSSAPAAIFGAGGQRLDWERRIHDPRRFQGPARPLRTYLIARGGSNSIKGPAWTSWLSTSSSAWNPTEIDLADASDLLGHSSSSSSLSRSSSPPTTSTTRSRGYYEGEPIESQLERFFQSTSTRFSRKHLRDLVNGACRMNSLRGMQLAHDVVEKWIVVSSGSSSSSTSATASARDAALTPPADEPADAAATTLELWQQVLYGWAVMAQHHPVAVVRMKEVVDRVVREAKRSAAAAGGTASRTMERGTWKTWPPPSNAPTVDLFNTYLYGLAQASGSARSSADVARSVLRDMEGHAQEWGWWCRPNTKSYMSVLLAYRNGRLPHAGEAALEILDHMIRAHHAQREQYEAQYGEPYHPDKNRRKIVTPDERVFTVALQAVVQSVGDTRKSLRHLLSNVPTEPGVDDKFWVSVIHAHARLVDQERSAAKRVEIARDAEQILRDYFPPGGTDTRDDPGTVRAAWNACLDTWSRVHAAEAPVECERILQDMLSISERGLGATVPPDTVSFNSCHYAWSKAAETKHHDNAWERSLELLQLQIDLGDAASQPDFQTYSLVVLACGNAHQVREARAVVDGMVARIRELPSPMQRNPAAPFSALLSAIAKMPESGASDSSTLGTDAWEAEVGTDSLYDMALQAYAEVVQDLYGIEAKPDHHTFSAMLRCIASHAGTGVERQTRAREVFDAACEAGEVSRPVVEGLEAAIGQAVARLWLRDLPRFWSRNVPAGFRGHSRRHGGKGAKSNRRPGGNVQRLDT